MMGSLLHTDDDFGVFLARIFLGIVILPHGLQKLLGMFGGAGFSGTVDFFVGSGIPTAVAILIIIGESFGAIALIIGLLTRLAALGIAIIMLGAIFMVHLQYGFFMNWFGNQAGEGFEYHLLALGLSLVVLIKGGGKWSIDKALVH
ncbi:MAG: DoxX family protein [Thermodesulfobacteriota bacterium]